MKALSTDFLIVGAGVVGLSLARSLRERHPGASIVVIEKEERLAKHSSGRNSGVMHAGFYYTADSLKAKFCRIGAARWRERCLARGLPINPCGKVVVAQNEAEQAGIRRLYERGLKNGVELKVISEYDLREIEPLARTSGIALYSPQTAVIDPVAALEDLARELRDSGVQILFGAKYVGRIGKEVTTSLGAFRPAKFINAAGLYADRIGRDFGVAKHFIVMPFKGIYLKSHSRSLSLRTHVYPVPNPQNPFLGVHFTLTVDGMAKIGPTAIPGLWRENYDMAHNFSAREMGEILAAGARLFWRNAFGFRKLCWEEMQKYRKAKLMRLANALVPSAHPKDFHSYARPGIRAQLLDLRSCELVQDFLVEEGDDDSLHVLNAVSPGFTASLSFADWIVERYIR